MKRNILFAFAIILFFSSNGQQPCIPNSSLQPNEVEPDGVSTNFHNGQVGVYYEATYSIHVPTDYSVFTIDYIKFNGIDGLPGGLQADVYPLDSIWTGGSLGCVKISGTPTNAGNYPLVLKQLLVITVMGEQTEVPYDNTNYFITINDTEVGLKNNFINDIDFSVSAITNSENKSLNLSITSNANQNVSIKVFSILGELIINKNKSLNIGETDICLQNPLFNSGIYIVNIYNEEKSSTIKVVMK